MSLILKYQLDFKPEIHELQISDTQHDIKLSSILHQINKKNNRNDLINIIYNDNQVDPDGKLDASYDPEKPFIFFGDEVQFNFYSNLSFKSMRTPTEIKLPFKSSPTEIYEIIQKQIPKEKSRFTPFSISVYISGGIKLETDLLTFLLEFHPYNLNLYTVITPEVNLNNLRSRQDFLNPYKLSKLSELNITCLAEYFHFNGPKAIDLTFTISSIVNFPPLPMIFLSLMQRGLTKEPFFQFISLLQTLFLGIDPLSKPETVFENIPYFCKYICSQYANGEFFSNTNGRLVFAPDLFKKIPNPFNDLWQAPERPSLFLDNYDFHVFPTNSIVRVECPCFAKNGLLLKEKQGKKNIFMNPITKELIERNVSSQFIRALSAKELNPDIKPSNVKQTTVFLVDSSDHIKDDKLEDIERKILKVYNDNACRFRVLSLNAMMTFGIHNLVVSKMDIYDPNFALRSRSAQIKGKSNIFQAINDAVDYLNAFNWNGTGVAYPNARFRIVLITAGYNDNEDDQKSTSEQTHDKSVASSINDSNSKADSKNSTENQLPSQIKPDSISKDKGDNDSTSLTYEDIKLKLLESDVVLDSFVMKKDAQFTPTIAKLCHYTGGSCIIVDDEPTALSILSQEAFLNIEFRKYPSFGDDSCSSCDTEFPNEMKIEGEIKHKLITVNQTLPKPSNDITRRILQEFKYIKSLDEQSSFQVFMVDKDIKQWRVFIKAPPKANLDEKWFYLLICFPDSYPTKPPQFKFISIPYHINVSNEGRICLNYLDYEYNSSLTVAYMIICILELLESPNYDDPIDVERKKLYTDNPKKFFENVKESTKAGKDSVEDWLKIIQT